MTTRETIFALASAPGRAGVAVIRLSGPDAGAILSALVGSPPPPRVATLRTVRSEDGEPIDQALVMWFPAPASFTGEDVAELHVHGGRAVLAAVSEALLAAGARPAGPGAFSRRAFEGGKLDLTQAEAIADLVDAETEAQRAQALRQLSGALGALTERWRSALIDLMARVEAEIDFPDEGDVADAAASGLALETMAGVDGLATEMTALLDDGRRGERVRDGLTVAIVGAPNVGKSTLLNRLAGHEAAIVADGPGTTRDVVEVHLTLAGQLVGFADTAGLPGEDGRSPADPIEAEGVRRALARAEVADLRLGVVDATRPETAAALTDRLRPGDLVWINKSDVMGSSAAARLAALEGFHVEPEAQRLIGSAASGAGMSALTTALASHVERLAGASEAPALTRARHRLALTRARDALVRAGSRVTDAPELAGEDLRLAARALGEISGRVDVEDVLDRLFAGFCIGK